MKSLVLVLGLLAGFIFLAGCVGENYPPIIERTELASLERDMMIDGHFSGGFFLGSGYIESVPSYFYYVKLSNGGYKLKTVPTEDCIIFMDEDKSPYLLAAYDSGHSTALGNYGDIGDEMISRKYGDEIFVDIYTNEKRFQYVMYYRTGDVELHIPPNSIIKQYKP